MNSFVCINKNMLTHYTDYKTILVFLKKYPIWISGYTTGEGCFTASVMLNRRARWGIWPQCEFNIAQSMTNKKLLIAINYYFDKTGGVYGRKSGVGTVSFRDLNYLEKHIIPFFNKYPLLGTKSLEFEIWIKLVNMLKSKKHIGSCLDSRDNLIKFLELTQQLNARQTKRNEVKLNSNQKIINWLKTLRSPPSDEAKNKFIQSLIIKKKLII
jgi:hypothetical protein